MWCRLRTMFTARVQAREIAIRRPDCVAKLHSQVSNFLNLKRILLGFKTWLKQKYRRFLHRPIMNISHTVTTHTVTTHTHIYIYTYIYIYTHTYIYIYIYTLVFYSPRSASLNNHKIICNAEEVVVLRIIKLRDISSY